MEPINLGAHFSLKGQTLFLEISPSLAFVSVQSTYRRELEYLSVVNVLDGIMSVVA